MQLSLQQLLALGAYSCCRMCARAPVVSTKTRVIILGYLASAGGSRVSQLRQHLRKAKLTCAVPQCSLDGAGNTRACSGGQRSCRSDTELPFPLRSIPTPRFTSTVHVDSPRTLLSCPACCHPSSMPLWARCAAAIHQHPELPTAVSWRSAHQATSIAGSGRAQAGLGNHSGNYSGKDYF